MRRYSLLLLTIILHLSIIGGAEAQYSWSIVHNSTIDSTTCTFVDVSCYKNYCTAIGSVLDTASVKSTRFWNSTDGGTTWKGAALSLPDSLKSRRFNAVSRIDAEHIFIVGDSGAVINSSDGGETWNSKEIVSSDLGLVHFSDPLTGITVGGSSKGSNVAFTTTGGSTWDTISFNPFYKLSSCFSDGSGAFRVFNRYRGPIYSTKNNWATIDSSPPLFENDPNNFFIFSYCSFSHSDTLIIYGMNQTGDFPTNDWKGLFMRSTNNGKTWEKHRTTPPLDSGGITWLYAMTIPNRDTIVAGGSSQNKLLISTDRGASWKLDTLPIPKKQITPDITKLVMLDNGNVVGIHVQDRINPHGAASLILGKRTQSGIKTTTDNNRQLRIHPNPSSSFVKIELPEDVVTIVITDALGRVVVSENTKDKDYLVNTSVFASGSYTVKVTSKRDTYIGTFIVTR